MPYANPGYFVVNRYRWTIMIISIPTKILRSFTTALISNTPPVTWCVCTELTINDPSSKFL